MGYVSSSTSRLIFTYRRSPSSRMLGVGTQDDYFVMQESAGSVLTCITPGFALEDQTKENSAFIHKSQADHKYGSRTVKTQLYLNKDRPTDVTCFIFCSTCFEC